MKPTDAQRRPTTWRDYLGLVIILLFIGWVVFLVGVYSNYDGTRYEDIGVGIITGHLASWAGMVVIFYFRKAGDKPPAEEPPA